MSSPPKRNFFKSRKEKKLAESAQRQQEQLQPQVQQPAPIPGMQSTGTI